MQDSYGASTAARIQFQTRLAWLGWILAIAFALTALTFGFFTNAAEFGAYAKMNFTSFNDGERTKNVHYVFMSLGYGAVMTFAVNAHRILPFSRDVNRHAHAALHTIAIAAIAMAFTYIYLYIKISGNDGPQFGNLHSQFGLGVVALSFALYAASAVIWYILPVSFGRFRVWVAPFHRFTGFMVYALSISQIFLALWVKQNDQYGPPYNLPHGGPQWIPLFLVIAYALALGSTVYNLFYRKTTLGLAALAPVSADMDPLNS